MTTRLFGEAVQRREDPRLLTGQGRYLDDLGPEALAAAFVRSPHAHARVRDVDVSAALDVEGLVAVYTWEDLPERVGSALPLLIPHPALTHGRTAHPLARDVVRHVGEPVVMVVATDRYAAEDACALIEVDYEPLKPVVGIEEAVQGAQLVHEDVPGNVGAHLVQEVATADGRGARQAIEAAPHTIAFRLDIERSASMPLEGRGVYARWDGRDLRVYSSTQTSTSVRMAVAAALGLPLPHVEVIAPDVGGGFGVKIVHPWPEEVLVPWAAMTLGREIKWTEDRREHFISSAHERGQVQYVRAGFDDDGRVLGLDVTILHDHGAYTPYGIIVPIVTSTQLPGPYKLGSYRVEFTAVYTNTVQVTPYRGAGRPQGVFCMERTMDKIARYLGKDRTEVRAANLIGPEEFPYDQGMTFQDGRPLIYDSGDYPEMLRMVKELIGWDTFEPRPGLGIGIGCYVEGTGVGPYEGGHVQITSDGRVHVSTGLTSQGQGHETAFAQIAATELGVPIERVSVVTGDTRRFGYAVGTFASRAAVVSGNAIALACRKVREKALRIAADALEANPDDLDIAEGIVHVAGAPSAAIPLSTVAVLANPLRYAFDEETARATQFAGTAAPDRPPVAEGEEPGLEGRDYYSPIRSTFAAGMHAAIVETDPDTAEIKVLRYAVVHDCGRLINPMIVEGQIHGGVAQGIGGALYERMVYDQHGQLVNASFMDFLMPYATEIPHVETAHLETPSPLNPLGIKGAGEAGVIPVSAVIASAVEDAEGIEINRMPISPSELFDLRTR
ncbi:aerobic carbon-monoxide dehydrogenase large subunit [Nonomuraea gerenzanensis]|uniref:Carbon monoxide dehydrogenase large chain parolog without usual motifs n=1 Tax=Nonomuraea gerenzanensis TaxID=93944 RepID=A0A1M4EJH5_9ACTN|nr:aerobic carbon-monoxide dehydrogenase large subunit [Nonomuraea gerenzanensis]UBU10622.1 xanthine dehydrogenase family protein molybdopterin-binding subunit [Nonomuraea gerenzanensis]SBO99035.1 Carbon monoxide dehydrogenase large chain parolog without usual motifs [Nonomuraea gerenzanensis]